MSAKRRAGVVVALALGATACGPSDPPAPSASGPPAFYWELPGEPESLVPLDEIVSGGVSVDGIPPIDDPRFIRPASARWLDDEEPVVSLQIDGDVRAYPLQILIWHEIVNDTVGGRAVVVTYCPLCNSAIVFDRTIEGTETTFGTSGRLYKSDLVMYDRATKSLWPQIMGTAVVGARIGTELETIPSSVISFADFRRAFPRGRVLSRKTGFDRDYGRNPYERYDSSDPFLFEGTVDDALPKIARVVGVRAPDGAKAYSVDALYERGSAAAVNDTIDETELVVLFKRGTKSAVDASALANSRDVGSAGVFSRRVGARVLDFVVDGGRFVDSDTGSTWDILGRALDGPLRGERLEPIDKVETFWFAWAVFEPDAPLWRG